MIEVALFVSTRLYRLAGHIEDLASWLHTWACCRYYDRKWKA
jgi:hypothetical protein